MPLNTHIDVFHGQLVPHLAKVYARVNEISGGGEWSLAGRVQGPECHYAKTLSTDAPLKDLGAGPTLLACATVPDPCPWSPELPSVYRVEIELRRENRVVHAAEQLIAFRGLGVRGRNFYWAGKRWVVRGVHRGIVASCPVSAWREESTAIVVDNPDDTLCEDASRDGVVLIARVAGQESEVAAELRRLAKWPAVAIALIASGEKHADDWRIVAPNLLLACEQPAAGEQHPAWACAAFIEHEVLRDVAAGDAFLDGRKAVPLVAVRPESRLLTVADARAACDALQRDLAPVGDFAGYVV